jgi:hypothetical protein
MYLMSSIFHEELDAFVVILIDDIILIFSNMEEEHNKHMARAELVRFSLRKFLEFWFKKVSFLGCIVNQERVVVHLSKVKDMPDCSQPQNVSAIQIFLGLAGNYHQFINNLSWIAKPITVLLKMGVKFEWSNNCKEPFQTLKTCLTTQPFLLN